MARCLGIGASTFQVQYIICIYLWNIALCYAVFVNIFLYVHFFKWSLNDMLFCAYIIVMIYSVLDEHSSAAVIVWLPCVCLMLRPALCFFLNKILSNLSKPFGIFIWLFSYRIFPNVNLRFPFITYRISNVLLFLLCALVFYALPHCRLTNLFSYMLLFIFIILLCL